MTPLEPTNSMSPSTTQGNAAQSQRQGLTHIDYSGLTRAITLLENGVLQNEAIVSLLKHELGQIQQESETLYAFAQQASVELRQIREAKGQRSIEQEEGARTIQDDNDQFVAQLLAEHETQLQSLRRERDAAVDRVRELSRGISRIGGLSSPNLRRISVSNLPTTNAADNELTLLRARVDELLFERERSLKLLRHLAEQRDQAESRLQVVLSSVPPRPETQIPSNLPAPGVNDPTCSDTALPATVGKERTIKEPAHVTESAVMRASSPIEPPSTPNTIDSGSDWDLSSPAKLPMSVKPSISELRTDPPRSDEEGIPAPQVSETTLPLLRKKSHIAGDGAGSYSISARELPAEEVVVVRSRPSHPQPKR